MYRNLFAITTSLLVACSTATTLAQVPAPAPAPRVQTQLPDQPFLSTISQVDAQGNVQVTRTRMVPETRTKFVDDPLRKGVKVRIAYTTYKPVHETILVQGVVFYDMQGKVVALQEVRKRVKGSTTIVQTTGSPLGATFRKMFKADVLNMVVPRQKRIRAPRLAPAPAPPVFRPRKGQPASVK